ncbi:MAG: formate dehydrogenase accessory sulfurtransferase FdhD [Kofleriaceae bacterium]
MSTREIAIERIDGAARTSARDAVVVEAPLQLRARKTPVATIMRTPGADVELVRGLLNAEGVGGSEPFAIESVDEDAIEVDIGADAFAGRGLLSSAACGVCGRVAIADLELRATEIAADTRVTASLLASLPARLREAQSLFAATGGLHAAGLFTLDGSLVAAREDVGRHNAVDKLAGWALGASPTRAVVHEDTPRIDPGKHVLVLSGRAGYELVQKAIMLGVPIVASVSAPSSLAIELAERFNVALVGFVRDGRANVYAHGWRIA